MREIDNFISWNGSAACYDSEKHCFRMQFMNELEALNNVHIESIVLDGKNIGGVEIFKEWKYESVRMGARDFTALSIKFSKGPEVLPRLTIRLEIRYDGVRFSVNTPKNCVVNFVGNLKWGDGSCENTYPMSTSRKNDVVRTANGPAASTKDDMLFDRLKDTALVLKGAEKIRIKYDWENKTYTFRATTGTTASKKVVRVYAMKDVLANLFYINYSPLNRTRTFKEPPIGWMTWYAVRFDANEDIVLRNAKWQSENLKDYGANAIWVDWEWCHKDFTGTRDDGVDVFNPDKEKYPHGLKYVSDKIREMGLTPALWIGFGVDSDMNEYFKENPDVVLADDKCWCGRYFPDMSHPKYLNEYLPKALNNVKEWGYEAIKWDTITNCKIVNQKYQSRRFDPTLTAKELQRNLAKRTREVLGEDMYMLLCAAEDDADVLDAIDFFESARTGNDIFNWKEFITNGVLRTLKYYPLHNNVFFADCDNLVLREEYNDYNQAASRVHFVTMLGLPLTFGDEFEVLDDARIELIKKSMPVLDIHPMDIHRQLKLGNALMMNLAIEKEWESYNVLNIFNKNEEKNTFTVNIENDLNIEEGEYLVYDYSKDKFVGCVKKEFKAKFDKHESRIFAIRKKLDRPQLLSTSRHVSQGASEIRDMVWKNNELTITADVIKGAEYKITLYIPDNFKAPDNLVKVENNVYAMTITPDKTGEKTFTFTIK